MVAALAASRRLLGLSPTPFAMPPSRRAVNAPGECDRRLRMDIAMENGGPGPVIPDPEKNVEEAPVEPKKDAEEDEDDDG